MENVIYELCRKKGFSYYPEDIFLLNKITSLLNSKNLAVLDAGCGNGHYSFLFEKCGANVYGFDLDNDLIEQANREKAALNSGVNFLVADGNYPERVFNKGEFDIIFLSGISLFARDLDKSLMKKYLQLLKINGILVFVQNSNLTGIIGKRNIKEYTMHELKSFFEDLDCSIIKLYFYDRHVIGRILKSWCFNEFSTKMHIVISRISKLPCNIVIIVNK